MHSYMFITHLGKDQSMGSMVQHLLKDKLQVLQIHIEHLYLLNTVVGAQDMANLYLWVLTQRVCISLLL